MLVEELKGRLCNEVTVNPNGKKMNPSGPQASWSLEGEWPPDRLESVPHCPVCRETKRELLYEYLTDKLFFAKGRWTFHKCLGCRSAYLDPRPSPEAVQLAYASYHTHEFATRQIWAFLRSLTNGYFNWKFGTHETPANPLGVPLAHLLPPVKARLDRAFRHLPSAANGRRILDVGCGNCTFLEKARSAGWWSAGVDPDPVVVDNARARGFDVRPGGIDAFQDHPEAFDIITMSHVIEHIHDPCSTLKVALWLLKPGGTLWIDTPNIDSVGHRIFGANWRGLEPPRHLVLFNWSSLEGALRALAFEQIRRLPYFHAAPWMFVASEDIKKGVKAGARLEVKNRLKAWLLAAGALLASRVNYDMTEFVTLTAQKPAMNRPHW